jgi:glycosyltransferase involved in cell wall biosynthesis
MFRFHLLGFPHTATNRDYCACAYTQKISKFIKMMKPRGHEIIHYGNEGSCVPCEHVQILSENERAAWFGKHDQQQQYFLNWDPKFPYWKLFNDRAIVELKKRVKKGDFILSLAGCCQQPIADAFPGSYSGTPLVWFVEYGIGYYGTFSNYRCYESNSHREWCHGKNNNTYMDFNDVVVPNYFDIDEFPEAPDYDIVAKFGDYYVFVGRIVDSKGWSIAVETTKEIGAKLVLVGQGDPGVLPKHVIRFGHADIIQKASLMHYAKAGFFPTLYREPFGGVAVECQLAGTPAITTDHGAFIETVESSWRCNSFKEFVNAANKAASLSLEERNYFREKAIKNWSLESIAPLYENYFARLHSRWGNGWYDLRDPKDILIG